MQHAYKGRVHHFNVQPGLAGKPMLRHHMRRQILDSLHLGVLGLPKLPWKHGVKNNASDDALELISEQLKEWKHPLDMRRKDDGRVRGQKWFTGAPAPSATKCLYNLPSDHISTGITAQARNG